MSFLVGRGKKEKIGVTCYRCGRSLKVDPNPDLSTPAGIGAYIRDKPYECKSCGVTFCLECLNVIKSVPCPACGKPHGFH